jgi:hypothetical protein
LHQVPLPAKTLCAASRGATLQGGNIAWLLVLLHLIFDVPDAADVAYAVEDALRFGCQHRAAQRDASLMRFDPNGSWVRASAAKLRANPRRKLIVVGRGRRTAKVRSDFGLQALQAIAQVPHGNVGRVPRLVTKSHAGVAEERATPRALSRIEKVHGAGSGRGASTNGHEFVHVMPSLWKITVGFMAVRVLARIFLHASNWLRINLCELCAFA